ncbi:carbohydrate kinase family protein [Patescibacteria group bacterium]|nr:carbohydrate kinase family protein [Patescibacteria group bacterium]
MQYDFVAIGDTVVDDFIRLKDATVNCNIDNTACTITMRFGDKIPFESNHVVYGVGNSANAAVAAARLGLKTAFISNVGADQNGEKILAHFKEEGVDASFVTAHQGIQTNYHYVLWFGVDRTILVKHQAYPYVFPKDLPEPKTIYLSSIGEGTEKYHDELADYLEAHPNVFLTFQPGTFQMKMGTEKLKRIYARTNLFVVNREEAARILKLKDASANVEIMAQALSALGPKIVLITEDVHGVHAYENGKMTHLPMYPDPKPPVQRTGAGDAFASTTSAFLTMGYSLEDAMKRGTINSAYVVQGIGAQAGLLTKDQIEKLAKT